MSIASEVQRIKTNIASAYDKCEEKGATMPDNENSANLADTIDSIPTGGGGGSKYDFLKAEGLKIKEQVHNGDWTYPYTSTGGHPETLLPDWTFSTGASYSYLFNFNRKAVFGYWFSRDLPNIIYKKIDSMSSAICAPPDAMVEEISASPYNYFKITFATEKYLLIQDDGTSNPYTGISVAPNTFSLNTTAFGYVEYLSITMTDSTYYANGYPVSSKNTFQTIVDTIFGNFAVPRLSYLKGISVNGYDFSSIPTLFPTGTNISKDDYQYYFLEMMHHIGSANPIDVLEQLGFSRESLENYEYVLSAEAVSYILNGYSGDTKFFSYLMQPDFPFALDMSGYSYANLVLSPYRFWDTSDHGIEVPFTKGVRLKNMGKNLYWKKQEMNFSLADIIYFIDNAQTVSTTTTFYIDSTTKTWIEAQDPTLLPALEAKGWTVSTS